MGAELSVKKQTHQDSVPFFGDLPLIGSLFKHTKQITTKSELVILLKPTVIDGPQQWARGMQRVRENLQRMIGKKSGQSLETD
jgi:MSHA biogenesis protein MshL